MTIKKLSNDDLLAMDKFTLDKHQPHISLDKDKCRQCAGKPCVYMCPAGLYVLSDGEVHFSYEGCLECGTCRVVCEKGGIADWKYPRGTFGVSFRQG